MPNSQFPAGDRQWRNPEMFLLLLTFAMSLSFATWLSLLNNFVIERAAFTGEEIGILHSLREVPGFLAFTAVFLLLVLREQSLALVAMGIMGLGVAVTGYFPSAIGLYCTTVLMSIGFHYYETIQQSLALQWFPRESSAKSLGKLVASKSAAAVLAYGLIWLVTTFFAVEYHWVYLITGVISMGLVLFAALAFPAFAQPHAQHKKIILRKRYWLYYALTFMGGARRQIFVVFAGFLMVEKFGYSVADVALLYLANHVLNAFMGTKIGAWISRVGERVALRVEYIGLALIFTGYAFVESANVAAALYILDHVLFAMAIAMKTYFQKIADPKDISATAAVSFSINHIAAVVIPAAFGLIWLVSPGLVFLLGAGMAVISLLLATNVPVAPAPDNITHWPSSGRLQKT
ncbi:MFS transporter [bacterium SCSIO 12696]|nr:MFS transporter [bacterium SCSIO 12696]